MKLGPEFLSVLPLERSNVKIHWLRNFFVKMLKGGWKIKSFNEYSVLSFRSRLLVMIFAYLSTQKRRFPQGCGGPPALTTGRSLHGATAAGGAGASSAGPCLRAAAEGGGDGL